VSAVLEARGLAVDRGHRTVLRGVDLALQAPPPTRVRERFFQRIAAVVRDNDLNPQRMTKELSKMLGEANAIAAMAAQVSPAERDADRAAANTVVRVLRFARNTDQSAIEAMIAVLTPK